MFATDKYNGICEKEIIKGTGKQNEDRKVINEIENDNYRGICVYVLYLDR